MDYKIPTLVMVCDGGLAYCPDCAEATRWPDEQEQSAHSSGFVYCDRCGVSFQTGEPHPQYRIVARTAVQMLSPAQRTVWASQLAELPTKSTCDQGHKRCSLYEDGPCTQEFLKMQPGTALYRTAELRLL